MAITKYTADELVHAIRDADDLNYLKYLVGASDFQGKKSQLRREELARLHDQYGYQESEMPDHIQVQVKAIESEEAKFESEYGEPDLASFIVSNE